MKTKILKMLLFAVTLISLVSCTETCDKKLRTWARKQCANNGGVDLILMSPFYGYEVVCENKARFFFTKEKVEDIKKSHLK